MCCVEKPSCPDSARNNFITDEQWLPWTLIWKHLALPPSLNLPFLMWLHLLLLNKQHLSLVREPLMWLRHKKETEMKIPRADTKKLNIPSSVNLFFFSLFFLGEQGTSFHLEIKWKGRAPGSHQEGKRESFFHFLFWNEYSWQKVAKIIQYSELPCTFYSVFPMVIYK